VAADLTAARALAKDAEAKAVAIEAALVSRATGSGADSARWRPVNDALVRLEQKLLDESEPPDARWYRHVIYGWNIYSLYEGQPLPGLAESMRLGDTAAVTRETRRIEDALRRFNEGLEAIARLGEVSAAR
jgi:hypothetical protein